LAIIKKKKRNFSDIDDQLHSLPPKFSFKEKESGITCVVSCSTDEYVRTSEILQHLLSLYELALPLSHCIRYWARVCEVDSVNEVMLNSCCYTLMVVLFLQRQNLLPVVGTSKYKYWRPESGGVIGELWIKLLRFADGLFRSKDIFISIIKDTERKKSAIWIQEPTTKQNLAKSASRQKSVEYIANCFEKSCKYFSEKAKSAGFEQVCKRVGTKSESELEIESDNSSFDGYRSDNDEFTKSLGGYHSEDGEDTSQSSDSADDSPHAEVDSMSDSDSKEQRSRNQSFSADTYTFDRKHLCGKMKRPRYCFSCKSNSHFKSQCPAERMEVKPLRQLTAGSVKMLNEICLAILKSFELTRETREIRNKRLRQLEKHIQQTYPAARLTLFGSSNNGFGFVNSDMDISMTFHGHEVYDVDTKKAIKGVETILRGYRFASKVTAIHSAKVPIVKFCFKDSEIEADISLYNILAQRNTELLLMYSQIDERVKLLGYTLKLFAKMCEIGDASRGTISSYGYIIMLIHYLQQRNPPVLPNLQELDRQSRTENEVEGWDTQFFDNLHDIVSLSFVNIHCTRFSHCLLLKSFFTNVVTVALIGLFS